MAPAPKTARLRTWLEERINLTEIFSLLTCFGLFPAELDNRLPVKQAVDEALRRPLPSYARWPRVLGILSVMLFAFLALTGIMLAFYYQPTVSDAPASVTTIVRDVSFGWFVHQMHGWAARLLLLILLLRVWRFFFQGLYKSPRELFWIVAALTFMVAAYADFTGRLLPWDATGYWRTVRGREVLHALPVLGPLVSFMVGGTEMDSLVLLRYYFLHVTILPVLLLTLFYLNFSSVRRLGLSASSAPDPAPGPGGGALRNNAYNLLILGLLVFGGLVSLTILLPAPFVQAADPFNTPPGVSPPWYLLADHAFLELFPSVVPRWLRGLLLEAILGACLLLPFIDRSPGRTPAERRRAMIAGVVVLLLWALFSWQGYRMEAIR